MSAHVLVCFAVPQEAKPFQKFARRRRDVRVLITGMGAHHAERSIRAALEDLQPSRVFTCGFAGALDPALRIGDVVCSHENPVPGAKAVRFTSADRVVITTEEKSRLRASTGADAVEMESATISMVCRKMGIACVILRAISDAADQDLPLDFNALTTAEQKLSPAKLALALLRAPHRIPALLRLGRSSALAARRLADVLAATV